MYHFKDDLFSQLSNSIICLKQDTLSSLKLIIRKWCHVLNTNLSKRVLLINNNNNNNNNNKIMSRI